MIVECNNLNGTMVKTCGGRVDFCNVTSYYTVNKSNICHNSACQKYKIQNYFDFSYD